MLAIGPICRVGSFPTGNTKRSCIKDPFGRAVNTREEVIDLFKDFPGAGIGIPTGPSNGITVVDIDIKNGVDGWFNLGALENSYYCSCSHTKWRISLIL